MGRTWKQKALDSKDEWLTPPRLVDRLGYFDLDPCSPVARPWPTATRHYTVEDNGLVLPWEGRVWLNPPYSAVGLWMQRLANHGNGVALVFARTETRWFFDFVWSKANAVLFLKGRLSFCHVSGEQGKPAPAPSVLVAYDEANACSLWCVQQFVLGGKLITLR